MRYLFLLLGSWFWMAPNGKAQEASDTPAQEWVDFLIGKPHMQTIEARQAVAKKWGIRYSVNTAGCVASEELLAQAQAYQERNQAYFEVLAQRYGADWLTYFERDVSKKQCFLQQQERPLQGTWYELIPKEQDQVKRSPHYLETKAAVAATWGVRYAPLYLSQIKTDVQWAEAQAKDSQSYAYVEQITQQLGSDDWIEWIEEEVAWRLLKATVPTGGQWQDPVWGQPDTLYYAAKAAIAQRWNIRYQPVYLGVRRTAPFPLPKSNGAYFVQLQRHFKTNWWSHFYRDVAKEYWKRQLIPVH